MNIWPVPGLVAGGYAVCAMVKDCFGEAIIATAIGFGCLLFAIARDLDQRKQKRGAK